MIKLIAVLSSVVKTNRQLQIDKYQLVAHCLVLASVLTGVVISSIYFNKGSGSEVFTSWIIF